MGAKIFGIDDEDAGIRDKKGQKIVVLKMMQDFEKVAFAGLGCSEGFQICGCNCERDYRRRSFIIRNRNLYYSIMHVFKNDQ